MAKKHLLSAVNKLKNTLDYSEKKITIIVFDHSSDIVYGINSP